MSRALLAAGDAFRRQRARRRALRRRMAAVAVLAAALGATIALRPTPLLVWNASASTPVGLYAVTAGAPLDSGDYVIARLPGALRDLAARRHYLPANVPLVKRVAAVPGDAVCAFGETIWINGRRAALRRRTDGMGRPMPWWTGCVRLRGTTHFLLIAANPASFDGRYFGPTAGADIIGKARLLWRR